jgi:hypothetical protein
MSVDLEQYLKQDFKPYLGKFSYLALGRLITFVKATNFCEIKPILAQINQLYSVSGMTKLLKQVGFPIKNL